MLNCTAYSHLLRKNERSTDLKNTKHLARINDGSSLAKQGTLLAKERRGPGLELFLNQNNRSSTSSVLQREHHFAVSSPLAEAIRGFLVTWPLSWLRRGDGETDKLKKKTPFTVSFKLTNGHCMIYG